MNSAYRQQERNSLPLAADPRGVESQTLAVKQLGPLTWHFGRPFTVSGRWRWGMDPCQPTI
jgi:hypothetical protein